jgi:hypothetical protein
MLALTFAPLLVRRSLSCTHPRAGSIGACAPDCSAVGRCSYRSPFLSWRCSCTGTCCGAGLKDQMATREGGVNRSR